MGLKEKKIRIVVGSENPVKKNAVREGFFSYFENIEVEGKNVRSDVPDQPTNDIETKLGAHNRAANAKIAVPDADFWVGIEGGIQIIEKGIVAFAWIVILSESKSGESRTTTFMLPERIATLITNGDELGTAIDKLFNQENSKQKRGAVGALTQGKISRTQLYIQAVQLALVPFINPDLF